MKYGTQQTLKLSEHSQHRQQINEKLINPR